MWLLLGFTIAGISFWLTVLTHGNPIPTTVFTAADVASAVGSSWMIYVALREEEQPWPLFWLAFVPFASLWYYFERVRPRRERKLSRQ